MLPLQIPQRAVKLTVAKIAAAGEACRERGQEGGPLVRLQRLGCIDDGNYLRFGESNHGHSPKESGHSMLLVSWNFKAWGVDRNITTTRLYRSITNRLPLVFVM